jgi:L,D-transpeptidase ErfK/SrfK
VDERQAQPHRRLRARTGIPGLAGVLAVQLLLACAARTQAPVAGVEPSPGLSAWIVGGASTYVAQQGDSLTRVSARFGVGVASLARANGLSSSARLRLGQALRIENPHIVPAPAADEPLEGLLINVPQRLLFLFRDGAPVAHFPVGLGAPGSRTPIGEFTITGREVDKTWYVPASIQEEMQREGKPVRTEVPPGPDNPLGRHWLGLSEPACGIHGTIAPASVYRFRTHGCIRLHPEDVAWLFDRVAVAEPVRIVYAPVLLAALPDGRIFLEVHRDVYGTAEPPLATLEGLAAAHGLAARIDWERAARVADEAEGLAREVSIAAPLDGGGVASGGLR